MFRKTAESYGMDMYVTNVFSNTSLLCSVMTTCRVVFVNPACSEIFLGISAFVGEA